MSKKKKEVLLMNVYKRYVYVYNKLYIFCFCNLYIYGGIFDYDYLYWNL